MKNLFKLIDNMFNYIFGSKIIFKNDVYLNVFKIFFEEIKIQIRVLNKNYINFKIFLYNLNFVKSLLLIYFFFIGVIPFLIVIFFWSLLFYIFVYILFSIIDLSFKILLIYTDNNNIVDNINKLFQKLKVSIFLIFEIIYYLFLRVINLILNFLTINWWYLFINKYFIKPIDKLLCKILDGVSKILINFTNIFKRLFRSIFKFFIALKDKWLFIYKPYLKKIIIKFKLLQFFKFNWFKFLSKYINCIFIFKNTIKLLFNKWFWLYFFKFYFYDIYLNRNFKILKFFWYNLIYKLQFVILSWNLNIILYSFKYNSMKYKIKYFYILLKYLITVFFAIVNRYTPKRTMNSIIKLNIYKKIMVKRISDKYFFIENNKLFLLLLHHKYLRIFYKLYIRLIYKYKK